MRIPLRNLPIRDRENGGEIILACHPDIHCRSVPATTHPHATHLKVPRASATGLGPNFAVHDNWATVGEGAIQDRTTEHLGYTDKVITHARRFLLDGIREVQEGGEAPGVVRDDTANAFHHLRVVDQVVDASVDWRNLWKEASHTAP